MKQCFLTAFNMLMGGREELIANCRLAKETLCDCSELDAELEELQREIEVVTELSKKAIYENASMAVNQDEWSKCNNSYLERHQKATGRLAAVRLQGWY